MIKIAEIAIPIYERTMHTEELLELADELEDKILNDFLYNNNEDMTKHVPWQVIKFPRLQKIWEDFVKIGHVRDEKGLDSIEDIMIQNTLKIYIFTKLTGHTQENPDIYFNEHFDPYLKKFIKYYKSREKDPNQYQWNFNRKTGKAMRPSLPKMPEKLENKYLENYISDNDLMSLSDDELHEKLSEELSSRFFDYYCEDPKSGQAYISDYGLKPLTDYLSYLIGTDDTSEKLYTIDKMLNVVHQRSDLASWFVEGGRSSLSKLSGTEDEND